MFLHLNALGGYVEKIQVGVVMPQYKNIIMKLQKIFILWIMQVAVIIFSALSDVDFRLKCHTSQIIIK